MSLTKTSEAYQRFVEACPECGAPRTEQELSQHTVAQMVREAFLATAELYKLQLDPRTAALVAKEEGELWAIQGRIASILKQIRSEHAA